MPSGKKEPLWNSKLAIAADLCLRCSPGCSSARLSGVKVSPNRLASNLEDGDAIESLGRRLPLLSLPLFCHCSLGLDDLPTDSSQYRENSCWSGILPPCSRCVGKGCSRALVPRTEVRRPSCSQARRRLLAYLQGMPHLRRVWEEAERNALGCQQVHLAHATGQGEGRTTQCKQQKGLIIQRMRCSLMRSWRRQFPAGSKGEQARP